ncbi:MAG TPA: tRNA dihydrouridine synthase DusB, partial [Mycobacteriales bacterium]|nr:tRNA dihydrouridine synthase DusB [Mycobacteriales bacterium]
SSLVELDERLAELDRSVRLPAVAHAMPRGHLNGPRQVTLPDRWLDTADDPTPPGVDAEALVSGG